MRTTLTLDPDVALQLKRRMAEKKIPFKRAVNDALRTGLANLKTESIPPFTVKPHHSRFKPGVDLDKLNQFVDELEAEETARKLQS